MNFTRRVYRHFHELTWNDFIRKVIFFISEIIFSLKIFRRIIGYYHFKRFDIYIGRNVSFYKFCTNIRVGKNAEFYNNTIFEFGPECKVILGDNVLFSYGVLLSVNKEVRIGDNVQVGEYTSIRDSAHTYDDLTVPMNKAFYRSETIIIGNDVWIGRGCIIMPGTIIEDGVVVGANSVVKGRLISHGIYAGSPCKFIKSRN